MVEAITRYLENSTLITDQKFGFRYGHSTSDLLLLLCKVCQDSLNIGLDALVVDLDFAGAFDQVCHRACWRSFVPKPSNDT